MLVAGRYRPELASLVVHALRRLAQIWPDGYLGPELVTLGQDLDFLRTPAFDCDNYATDDVVRYLTGEQPRDAPERTPRAAPRGG